MGINHKKDHFHVSTTQIATALGQAQICSKFQLGIIAKVVKNQSGEECCL